MRGGSSPKVKLQYARHEARFAADTPVQASAWAIKRRVLPASARGVVKGGRLCLLVLEDGQDDPRYFPPDFWEAVE